LAEEAFSTNSRALILEHGSY